MTDTIPPPFVFAGVELLERALHAQVLARRRATFEHDLKNVMHGLLSGTELLGKSLTASSARIAPAECLALLQQQLTRAQGTLSHLLDEIAPATHEPSDIAVDPLLEQCARDLRHQLQRFELTTVVEPHVIVRASRSRLKDVLLCVLLDAMDRAPARATFALTARREGEHAASIELRHPLAAEASPSDALVYIGEILSADGGRIDVSSQANQRSVIVRVPSVPAAQVDMSARRLVIVDANRDAADSLAMLVQLEGFQSQAAYDVEAAVRSAQSQPTFAVVLDVDGSIDANGAIARLRESSPRVRIIGMSHSTEQRVAQLDAQLRKPLDLTALRAVLDQG